MIFIDVIVCFSDESGFLMKEAFLWHLFWSIWAYFFPRFRIQNKLETVQSIFSRLKRMSLKNQCKNSFYEFGYLNWYGVRLCSHLL